MTAGRVLIGIDDTDSLGFHMGTGKLARLLADELCLQFRGLSAFGVVRHQLLVDSRIPFTSHNSPACVIIEIDSRTAFPGVSSLAGACMAFVRRHACATAAPGLCVSGPERVPDSVVEFGRSAGGQVLTKQEATAAARHAGVLLREVAGNGNGVIGALAAVGLTTGGDAGRFLEFRGALRSLPDPVGADALRDLGMGLCCMERNADPVPDGARIHTDNWVRPRLIGGMPVLLVEKGRKKEEERERWCCVDRGTRASREGTQTEGQTANDSAADAG